MSWDMHIIESDQGDWIGVYCNGELIEEGHSLSAQQLLRALGLKYTHESWDEEKFNEHGGRCPERLPE